MKTVTKLLTLFMALCVAAVITLPGYAATEEKTLVTSVIPEAPGNVAGSVGSMPGGWAGMKITVGANDLHVTALGRWYTPESNVTHNFLIANMDGSLVLDYGLAVANAPADAVEGFVYATIAGGVTLYANTSYYIVSDYWGADDKFYSAGVATTTDAATIDGVVIGTYDFYAAPGIGWGPLDLKYEVEKPIPAEPAPTEPKPVPIQKPLVESIVPDTPGNTEGSEICMPAGWAGMKITVGDRDLHVTALGRWHTPDSKATHNFLIANMDGSLVLDYGMAIATAGADAREGFVYGNVNGGVTLKANTSYYIVSDYWGERDKFYAGGVANTSDAATIDGIVILADDGYQFHEAPGVGWGPLDIIYTQESSPASGDAAPVAIFAAMSAVCGLAILSRRKPE